MQVIRQKGFIRGLHVYKVQVNPGDNLSTSLDLFWMNENPSRYSIACYDNRDRKVGHINTECEASLRPMMEFGNRQVTVSIPMEARAHNNGELGYQIGQF